MPLCVHEDQVPLLFRLLQQISKKQYALFCRLEQHKHLILDDAVRFVKLVQLIEKIHLESLIDQIETVVKKQSVRHHWRYQLEKWHSHEHQNLLLPLLLMLHQLSKIFRLLLHLNDLDEAKIHLSVLFLPIRYQQ